MPDLLPVGVPGGIVSGFAGIPDGSGIVRAGRDINYLDPPDYMIWAQARLTPDQVELTTWAEQNAIPDPSSVVTDLTSHHLLVDNAPANRQHVGALALQLVGELLGNGAAGRSEFRVTGLGGQQVLVDALTFETLLRSDGATAIATISAQLDRDRPDLTGGDFLLTLQTQLVLLLQQGVIRLDRPDR